MRTQVNFEFRGQLASLGNYYQIGRIVWFVTTTLFTVQLCTHGFHPSFQGNV